MSDCVDCHYSGAGGRIGAGSSLGAYVRKIAALEKVDIDQDPRESVHGSSLQLLSTLSPF